MSEADQTRKPQPAAEPERADSEQPEPGEGGCPPGVEEVGGPRGPEPTRYGDWEKGGRCSDF